MRTPGSRFLPGLIPCVSLDKSLNLAKSHLCPGSSGASSTRAPDMEQRLAWSGCETHASRGSQVPEEGVATGLTC